MKSSNKVTRNKKDHFTNSGVVDAVVDLPLIDRVRLVFGCKMQTHTLIKMPWRTDIEVHSTYGIEKIFNFKRFIPKRIGLWWTSRNTRAVTDADAQEIQA